MSEKLREKLDLQLGYLNHELDDLRQLRSLSPRGVKINRNSSRSPMPKVERSPPPALDPEPPTPRAHDSRPDIAAWPAPPPAARILSKPTNYKTIANQTLTFRSQGTSPIPEVQMQPCSSTIDENAKLLNMLRTMPSYSPVRGGREFELRRKIQNLEETVAEYERQKFNVMGTFSEYREYVAERERTLEAEYSNKIIALSEEVLGAKKDFEARMKSFQALQEQFEQEKQQALENLRQEHQKEIEVLERRVAGSQLLNLEQKYIIEIRRLEDERKSLQTEKNKLGESFDTKLRRAQSLYETQLSAAKILYSKELEALKDHEKHLKEELEARHEEFRDRIQELKMQSKQSREEVTACKTEINLLQKKLKQKENELEFITKELENARIELRTSMRKLREVDARLLKTTEELGEKETSLNKKAELLEAAENTRNRLESSIRRLQVEVKTLKNKVDFLEIERDNLKCQSESQSHLQNTQVQALEAVLESVTKEKETSKEHYERLLEQEREQTEQREMALRKELCDKFNELEDQYNSLKEFVDSSENFGPDSVRLLEELELLRGQKCSLEEEVSDLKAQLTDEKEKTQEEPSLEYVLQVLRSVEGINNSISGQGPSDVDNGKVLDIDVELLKRELLNRPQNSQGRLELTGVLLKLADVDKGVREIVQEKNNAQSKVMKLEEENRQLAAMLEQSSAIQTSRTSLENSEMTLVRAKLENAMHDLESERARSRQLELQLRRNDEAVEEMSIKTRHLREEVEESVRGQFRTKEKAMARRVSDLQEKLTLREKENDQSKEALAELEEQRKQTELKNHILSELVQYQCGSTQEALTDIMEKIGDNASDLQPDELHQLFESYEELRKPEKPSVVQRHIETSTKPEVREMALQANIVVVQAEPSPPPPSESEVVQGEIIQMLSKLFNGSPDQLTDLVELKNALQDATDEKFGIYRKSTGSFSSLLHHISEHRGSQERRSNDNDSDIRRSRSPSILSRLRERTPSKARLDSALGASTSMGSRNYLDIERSSSSSRKKYVKDATRPAWKF